MLTRRNQARMGCGGRRSAFTLIELLVVVAIIALLISILLPSMSRARDQAKAVVCSNHMRQLLTGGSIWLMETNRARVPASTGWAVPVLKAMAGVTEPFLCPTDDKPNLIAPMQVNQQKRAEFSEDPYPPLYVDGACFARTYQSTGSRGGGYYRAAAETEAMHGSGAGGLFGDRTFNDFYINYSPQGSKAKTCRVWAEPGNTGRTITLLDWRGRNLGLIAGRTADTIQPSLYGSFGLNLSSGLRGAEKRVRQILYVEYREWSAITEQLSVPKPPGWAYASADSSGQWRIDDPREMVGLRHAKKANAGFLDGHVERLAGSQVATPWNALNPLWHPDRSRYPVTGF